MSDQVSDKHRAVLEEVASFVSSTGCDGMFPPGQELTSENGQELVALGLLDCQPMETHPDYGGCGVSGLQEESFSLTPAGLRALGTEPAS